VEQTILTQDLTRAQLLEIDYYLRLTRTLDAHRGERIRLPRRPDQAGCGARCPDALLTAAGGVLPSESR